MPNDQTTGDTSLPTNKTGNSTKKRDILDFIDLGVKLVTSVAIGLGLALLNYNNKLKETEIETTLKYGAFTKSLISDLIANDTTNLQPDLALITLYHTVGKTDRTLVSDFGVRMIENHYNGIVPGEEKRIRAIMKIMQKYDLKAYDSCYKSVIDNVKNITNRTNSKQILPEKNPNLSVFISKLGEKDLDKVTMLSSSATVFIQVGLTDTTSTAIPPVGKQLQDSLKTKGFNVPAIEGIKFLFKKNSVKYYNDDDLASAQRVKAFVASQLNKDVNLEKLDVKGVRNGLIELWIARQ